MAASKNPRVIDGYTSVQALRHAGKDAAAPRLRPSSSRLPETAGAGPGEDGGSAPRISQTATPTRHEFVCYECGYRFAQSGAVRAIACPKCRKSLETADLVVDAERCEDVRTLGDVEITPGGAIRNASVVARDLRLAGDATATEVTVWRQLILLQGGRMDFARANAPALVIAPGCRLAVDGKLNCRDLVIEGELRAAVASSGVVTVRSGGLLRGQVRGAHLVVEDGGGLVAEVRIDAGSAQRAGKG